MNPLVGATLCSINPWVGRFAAGLIWNLPIHAHTPGVFSPHSRQRDTATHPPIGAISMGVEFFIHLWFFFFFGFFFYG